MAAPPASGHDKCPATGKDIYRTARLAWAASSRINRRWHDILKGGKRLHSRPYRCEHCHQWHTTSRASKEDREK